MNSFSLKLFAICAMALAHIGFFFFPDNLALFIIGRTAFPIFGFLTANGAIHTHNTVHYALRLFLFACISQIPFMLTNRLIDGNYWHLNILFTLTLGLLCVIALKHVRSLFLQVSIIVFLSVFGMAIQVEYGAVGVLMIVFSYLLFSRKKLLLGAIAALLLIYQGYQLAVVWTYGIMDEIGAWWLLPYSLLALIPIGLYNGKKGKSLKYAFYAFYPLHYAAMYLLLR